MSERDENPEAEKPKTSKLATASAVSGLAALCWLFTVMVLTELALWSKDTGTVVTRVLLEVCGPVALILGVCALVKIRRGRGRLGGKTRAWLGVGVGGFLILEVVFCYAVWAGYARSFRLMCEYNLQELGQAIHIYAKANEDNYPAPDKWCDLLIEGDYTTERLLICKGAVSRGDSGPCHYAINADCELNSPRDMVLLFETGGGWNKSGEVKLLTTENHRGKGCNVLFNDGSVGFVKAEDLGKLKWKPEKAKGP